MRDYLYLWHDTELQCLVSSGIEFKDLVAGLRAQGSGVALLDRNLQAAYSDSSSGFDFFRPSMLDTLAAEDIYSWGNFPWADFAHGDFPKISDEDIAALLFFARRGRPLHEVALPSVHNKFLGFGHDDGWRLKLYYSTWQDVESLLLGITPLLTVPLLAELQNAPHGLWLENDRVEKVDKTYDIDSLMRQRS